MTSNDGLARRRAAMIAAGYWSDQTLLDHLNRAIERTPDKTALVAIRSESGEEKRLAYREIGQLSNSLAAQLAQIGIGRGDVVSFQLPNWWQFPVLHLACLKLGAISNPLMTIFRERELRFMLRLAESKVLVVPTAFRGFDYATMAENLRGELPALRRVFVVGGSGDSDFARLLAPEESKDATTLLRERRLAPDDVIQLLYTSGTTGEPKGVMHTSNTMLSNLAPFAERLHLDANDVIHMPSPMAHQLGFMYGIVMPVMLGATAVLQDVFEPKEMARQIAQERVTFTMGATPFLSDLTEHVERNRASTAGLRVFVSAGAPIPRALVSKARQALGAAIISAWGMSENGAVTTTRPEDPEEKTMATDGCALLGMEVRVVDVDRNVVATGCRGTVASARLFKLRGLSETPGTRQHRRRWLVRYRRSRPHGCRGLYQNCRSLQGHYHPWRRKHPCRRGGRIAFQASEDRGGRYRRLSRQNSTNVPAPLWCRATELRCHLRRWLPI